MKTSIKKIIDQFRDYPDNIRDFLTEVILLEEEKLNVDNPQVIDKMNQILDKVAVDEDN